MRLWRICRRIHAAEAFSGEGARLYGGRWNSPGVKVVYSSPSLALATVETFVNLEANLQPDDLVLIEAELPDKIAIERVDVNVLPRNWHSSRNESLRKFGDEWIRLEKTVALQVPSAAVRGEWNVLLNPVHEEFGSIRIAKPQKFRFDVRMFQGR